MGSSRRHLLHQGLSQVPAFAGMTIAEEAGVVVPRRLLRGLYSEPAAQGDVAALAGTRRIGAED